MPELPEVEFARRTLARWTRQATIERVHVQDARVVRPDAKGLAAALVGRAVRGVDRKGKWLRVRLDDGARLFAHLGMSGKWRLEAHDAPALRSERVRIDLARGAHRRSLRYVDPRMFGRLIAAGEDVAAWRALGPDPLTDGIDGEALAEALAARRTSIKEALLDQTLLAGIGNIQATEALWNARLDPRARADALATPQVRALARGIHASLARTLALQGAKDETLAYVEDAGAPNPFRVYGRAGEPCPRCRTPLVRIVQAGRATTFCPTCQAPLGTGATRATRGTKRKERGHPRS